ncbi:TPA: hemerythrin domain-containing protein [Legionella feeleii]|uniref:Uncharacterized conserved protein n=1 Tax=Legionella feeleii TaxID=453 RepID=A0A0W0TIR6_9GAMM|nr:hemerythrin domain-containing protein [Legionella feeleii]KTC95500.1 hypothetical protein Lfee_3165 [Legionella feeleii]SPX60084.1 Uncharacterized conserved protein [Legionella feeleii]
MDAISFLVSEHNKVRKTLNEIANINFSDDKRQPMFESLCNELIRHEAMEHKVWYPCFKDNAKLDSTVKHLLREEKSAERAIKEFNDIKTQQEWEEKFARFKNNVIHHAEEEENKLFPQVKSLLDHNELELIGERMSRFKNKYDA